MDAFESIVAIYFEEKGYWVKGSVKVEISKEDKRLIGTPSMPRPEIDLVAYNPGKNELLLIEAKSYLDSPGVKFNGVSGNDKKDGERYKLFTREQFRNIITKQIRKDFISAGLIDGKTRVKYCLVAGNVYSKDENKIDNYFLQKKWIFIKPSELRNAVIRLSEKGWENDAVTITAKLISQ